MKFRVYVKDRFGPGRIFFDVMEGKDKDEVIGKAYKRVKDEYQYSKGEPRHKRKDFSAHKA